MNKRLAAGIGAVTLGAVVLVGCSMDKFTEPFKDAPRSGRDDGTPMDVIRMSDGFSNVGTKCVGKNRIFVLYHGDKAYGSLAVVGADLTCTDGGR